MILQVDIPSNLNKELKVLRIKKEFKNLGESVLFILEKHLAEEVKKCNGH